MSTVRAAGFVVYDETAVWGFGTTSTRAWADFLRGMKMAGTGVLTDAQARRRIAQDQHGGWTRASSFILGPCTAALMMEVAQRGGDLTWGTVDGIQCTREEQDAAEDAAEKALA